MTNTPSIHRSRILLGASQLLQSGCWADFTVGALTHHLKMSRSTLYRCFASKEAVVDALVAQVCDSADRRLLANMTGPAVERLERFVEVYCDCAGAMPHVLVIEPGSLPSLSGERLDQSHQLILRTCIDILKAGMEQGSMVIEDAHLAAVGLVTGLNGVVAHAARSGAQGAQRTEAIRGMADIVVAGLRREPVYARRITA